MICFLALSLPLFSGPTVETEANSEMIKFQGEVTAVNSNNNRPGVSFTAIDRSGQVKMFYIASLNNLDLRDRVELTYKASGKFPLEVVRIRFLSPNE